MKADRAYKIDKCRLCGSEAIQIVSKLASTPMGDKFMYDAEKAKEWNSHKVELALCSDCGNIQLSEVVEPEQVYDDYIYTTAISHGLSDHFMKGVEKLIETVKPAAGSLIVEIGSNEGVILRAFKEKGYRVLGIDPADEIARIATENGTETLPEFFDKELAEKIAAKYGKTSLMIATNVIANIPDLHSVAEGIDKILEDEILSVCHPDHANKILEDDGVFVFETSYALDVVQKHLLDTIYHEHISYLSAAPLEKFFERYGFCLFDAERIYTKGGSLRGYVKKQSAGAEKTERLRKIIKDEETSGIFGPDMYKEFNKNLAAYGEKIRGYVQALKDRGEKIVVYGASMGCIMMIYQFELENVIDFIVDDNKAKIDRYSPGTAIKVYDSDILNDGEINTVISMAWRFMEPICKKHQKYLKNGGRFAVLNLDKLEIEEI